jgi:hypothetical protein
MVDSCSRPRVWCGEADAIRPRLVRINVPILNPAPFHPADAGVNELDNFLHRLFATSHHISPSERIHWNTESLECADSPSVFACLLWSPFVKLVAVAFNDDDGPTMI